MIKILKKTNASSNNNNNNNNNINKRYFRVQSMLYKPESRDKQKGTLPSNRRRTTITIGLYTRLPTRAYTHRYTQALTFVLDHFSAFSLRSEMAKRDQGKRRNNSNNNQETKKSKKKKKTKKNANDPCQFFVTSRRLDSSTYYRIRGGGGGWGFKVR